MTPDDLLYEAERAVAVMGFPVRFSDGESAAAYFEHVVTTKWFMNRWPAVVKRDIQVKGSKHQHAWADFTNNVIFMPPWSLTDYTLLHEVAHFAAAREFRWETHGPIFRGAHHQLIQRFMSREAAACYRNSCLAYGLDF